MADAGHTSSNEEVPSDSEEEGRGGARDSPQPMEPELSSTRKRKRPGSWKASHGKRDYAGEIASGFESLRSYRAGVISKWNEKTKLASGRITSKVGVVVVMEGK